MFRAPRDDMVVGRIIIEAMFMIGGMIMIDGIVMIERLRLRLRLRTAMPIIMVGGGLGRGVAGMALRVILGGEVLAVVRGRPMFRAPSLRLRLRPRPLVRTAILIIMGAGGRGGGVADVALRVISGGGTLAVVSGRSMFRALRLLGV